MRDRMRLSDRAAQPTRRSGARCVLASGGQSLGGNGSGGRERPSSAARRCGQTVTSPGGVDGMKAATPSAGVTPTQATVQRVASGGHGALLQEGQCCEQSPPSTVCSAAGAGEGAHAKATVGNPAAKTARQPSSADRIRKCLMSRNNAFQRLNCQSPRCHIQVIASRPPEMRSILLKQRHLMLRSARLPSMATQAWP